MDPYPHRSSCVFLHNLLVVPFLIDKTNFPTPTHRPLSRNAGFPNQASAKDPKVRSSCAARLAARPVTNQAGQSARPSTGRRSGALTTLTRDLCGRLGFLGRISSWRVTDFCHSSNPPPPPHLRARLSAKSFPPPPLPPPRPLPGLCKAASYQDRSALLSLVAHHRSKSPHIMYS